MKNKARTAVIWIGLVSVFLLLIMTFDVGGDGLGPVTRGLILGLVPFVLLVGALVYFVRRQNQGQGGATWLELKKTRARKVDGSRTSFADVGGHAEAKQRLADVVDFLRNPAKWQAGGVRLPRGVLLEGPAGSGKTLLARAVAGEAGVAVFEVSASEFVEMFVGVGAARVRDTFETAVKAAPAVIFVDELDAIGRRRGSGIGGSHDEREQTLNQLLVCLDGFRPNERLVVIAATNRADILDTALLRPGRFDIRVTLQPITQAERVEVLRIHCRDKKLAPDVSTEALAARLEGWTGAAIELLCNEAATRAVRRGGGPVTQADFDTVLAAQQQAESRYDAVDVILTESASQLARPPATALLRLEMDDGSVVQGTVVWADSSWVKVEVPGGELVIVPKRHVRRVTAVAGTTAVAEEQLAGDRWANLRTDAG